MATSLTSRLLLAATSTAVATALAYVIWTHRPAPTTVVIRDTTARITDILQQRHDQGPDPTQGESLPSDQRPLVHWTPLDPKTVEGFYPAVTATGYEYEPTLYLKRAPNLALRVRFVECPGGFFTVRTNSAGLRDDAEIRADKPTLRILFTGDSHTEGVLENAKNLTHRTGDLLRKQFGDASVETLNAAVGHYNLYNYLGVLHKYLELAPDVFVVVVYGGNDFSGVAMLEHYFNRRRPPTFKIVSDSRVTEWVKNGGRNGAYPQDLGQAFYFLNNPDDIPVAADTSVAIIREIARLCHENDVLPLVVYLPSASIQYERYAKEYREILSLLDFPRDPLPLTQEIADRFVAGLAAANIDVLDLRADFAAAEEPYYWYSDLHLNTVGHERVAELVAEALRGRLDEAGNVRPSSR